MKASQDESSGFFHLMESVNKKHINFELVIDNLSNNLKNKDGSENTKGWYKFIALLLSKLSDGLVFSTLILATKEHEKRKEQES